MRFARTWLVAIALSAMIGISAGSAQTVVSNNNVDFNAAGTGLTIAQDVAGNDLTSAELVGGSAGFGGGVELSLFGFTLDEGSDWYEVVPGQELSIASTLAGNNDLWGTSLDPSLFPVSPTPISVMEPFFSNPMQLTATSEFYVGFATTQGDSAFPNGPADRDVFGWARIVALGFAPPGEPQIVEDFLVFQSAIAYDSAGIIVGTTQAISISVPEPSTSVVLMMGTLLLARRRRSTAH